MSGNLHLNKQSEKSLSGSLLEIVGPLLIMLMVGSVVWFLIEVFYRGPHIARLCWVFGLFTGAAVLVSRISIESSRERSFIFGVPLALAAIFVSLTLIEGGPLFPVMLIAFVLLILWLSDRLTWDATVIDESRDVSAVGLIELARRRLHLSGKESNQPVPPTEHIDTDTKAEDDPIDETASDAQAGNLIKAFTAKGKRRNVPGIWSLYFSIGALAVFGIGQLFVQPDADWGYFWVSTLFALFIAAAMSLMTLTSLLGLQRYLLKRKLDMPDDLPRRWLTAGITVAICAAILTLLVPRPNLGSRMENAVAWLTSRPRDPSKLAFGKDGTQQGENPQSATNQAQGSGKQDSGKSNPQPVRDNSQNDQSNPPQSNSGNSQTGPGGTPGGDKGNGKQSPGSESGGKQPGGKSGDSKSGQQKSDSNKSQGKQSGDESDSSSQQNKSGDPNNPENKQKQNNDPSSKQNDGKKPENQKQGGSNTPPPNGNQPQKQQSGGSTGSQANQPPPPPQDPSGGSASLSSTAGKFAKTLVMFAGLIALLVVAWLFRDEIAKLLVELRNWLDGLSGKKAPEAEPTADLARIAKTERQIPFAECRNPFRDGSFRKLNPKQLAQETFKAMEALAAELKVTRAAELTPAEFAAEVASSLKGLAVPAKSLADVYGWAAYSGSDVSPDQLQQLQLIWQQMEQFSSGRRATTA